MMMLNNLFKQIPVHLPNELIQQIASTDHVRIERIVSRGHASPPGFWYDQAQREWVMVLKGRARLRFEADDRVLELRSGDHLNIAAHERHRVEWTDPDRNTIWLAVFY